MFFGFLIQHGHCGQMRFTVLTNQVRPHCPLSNPLGGAVAFLPGLNNTSTMCRLHIVWTNVEGVSDTVVFICKQFYGLMTICT